jgi:hypothetical protein
MTAAVVDRSALLKLLKGVGSLDSQGLSPFVGVQLAEDHVEMYRTGLLGYSRTIGANPGEGEWLQCSAQHFTDCLKVFQGERVGLSVVKGVLMLSEVDSTFETELRIYTVPKERAGQKSHRPGNDVHTPDPGWFSRCNVSAIPTTPGTPSVIEGSTLRMVTPYGAVFFTGSEDFPVNHQPRNSTLSLYGGRTFDELSVTEAGYYRSVHEGIEVMTAGYKATTDIFANYKGISKELARYPAGRFVYALGAASAVAVATGPVIIDPNQGISTRDQHGNLDKFGVTATGAHPVFTLSPKAAQTIADVLKQCSDAEVVLSELPGNIFRLTRGPWDFNFKAVLAHVNAPQG